MFGPYFFLANYFHADYFEAGGGIAPTGLYVKERWGIKIGIAVGF